MQRTLVLEPDYLVAADISEIVREIFPCGEISVHSTYSEAMKTLAPGAKWDVVIANNTLFQGAQNKVREILEQSSCLRILLDVVDELDRGVSQSWLSLSYPFSDSNLRATLRAALEKFIGTKCDQNC